jgi:hypothetical protein
MMTTHHLFEEWRAILATMQDTDSRLSVFRDATADIITHALKGQYQKSTAVDELMDEALVTGLMNDVGQIEIEKIIGDSYTKLEQENAKAKANGKEPPPLLMATPYAVPVVAEIPRRAWLYGGHYIRDVATATVAPGGFGKTTLTLYEALVMVLDGLRVWYISGEDPKVEIDRRIAAHCVQHSFNLNLLNGNGKLFVDDRATFPFFIAKSPRAASVLFDDKLLFDFEGAIAMDQIDVVMLDPFVSFHSVPENDNGAIDAVCKRLGGIAYRQHCCIEISHHVRKSAPGQISITVDDTRGGGAIVNAVRSSRVINRMSSNEAERAGIESDKRSSYIRLDRGKRNMAPADEANWYHIVSVALSNGDNVQSLLAWDFPKTKNITLEDTDWVTNLVRNNPATYRTSSRSPDWLGVPLAERFELDVGNKSDAIFINKALGGWLKAGVLVKVLASDESRRKREFFSTPGSRPPDQPDDNVVPLFDDEEGGD